MTGSVSATCPKVRTIWATPKLPALPQGSSSSTEDVGGDTTAPRPATTSSRVLDCAYVIHDAFGAADLERLETLRQSIPLDRSRPTCPRRFVTEKPDDATELVVGGDQPQQQQHREDGWIGELLNRAVASWNLFNHDHTNPRHQTQRALQCLPWYRFLEYEPGASGMDRHTDGSNVHHELSSVATMLVYLSTCCDGGTTTLYCKQNKSKQPCFKRHFLPSESEKDSTTVTAKDAGFGSDPRTGTTNWKSGIIESIPPVYNTVLIFPHSWPHSGDAVGNDPKIVLRVDLAWKTKV